MLSIVLGVDLVGEHKVGRGVDAGPGGHAFLQCPENIGRAVG